VVFRAVGRQYRLFCHIEGKVQHTIRAPEIGHSDGRQSGEHPTGRWGIAEELSRSVQSDVGQDKGSRRRNRSSSLLIWAPAGSFRGQDKPQEVEDDGGDEEAGGQVHTDGGYAGVQGEEEGKGRCRTPEADRTSAEQSPSSAQRKEAT